MGIRIGLGIQLVSQSAAGFARELRVRGYSEYIGAPSTVVVTWSATTLEKGPYVHNPSTWSPSPLQSVDKKSSKLVTPQTDRIPI